MKPGLLRFLRILHFTVLVALVTGVSGYSQSPIVQWQKTFGGPKEEQAYAITPTADRGFILAGGTQANGGDVRGFHGGTSDIWVIKINSLGQLVWQKTFGGSDYEQATAVTATSDGGFVVAGFTSSNDGDVTNNHGNNDFWIIKLNSAGNMVWQKTFGGSDHDIAWATKATDDGGCVVAGYTASNDGDVSSNHGSYDFWVIKLSSNGQLIWQKTLGGKEYDSAQAIISTTDGGFVVGGFTHSNDGDVSGNHGDEDGWLVKINSAGTLVWQKTVGGSDSDRISALTPTANGGFVLAGETFSTDLPGSSKFKGDEFWVVKLNNAHEIEWQKIVGGERNEAALALIATNDGGYIVAGREISSDGDAIGNHGSADFWVIKINSTGQLIWQKPLGGTGAEVATSITMTTDGSYVVAGFTNSNNRDVSGNHGQYDFWVVNFRESTLQMLSPNYNCASGQITFRTTGGDGSPIQYQAAGVTPWSNNSLHVVEQGVRSDRNSQPLTLLARQNGQIITRTFDLFAYCQGINQPPVFTGPIPDQFGLIYDQSKSFGYQLPPGTFSDPEGQALTLSVTGLPPGLSFNPTTQLISGFPAQVGAYTAILTAADPQGASTSVPVVFAITSLENPDVLFLREPQYDCTSGQITFRTVGGDGSPIEYTAAGVTPWSTAPTHVVELGVRLDPNSPPLTLMARQKGQIVTRTFDLHSFCSSPLARRGVEREQRELQVRVLSNPIVGNTLQIEVRGAESQPLHLQVSDLQGRLVVSREVKQAGNLERHGLPVGALPSQRLVLRVSTLTNSVTINVLQAR